jgi:hypothetical protein
MKQPYSLRSEHFSNIKEMLVAAAHYLPAQGPMNVFVHHNTLHAFQHLPFQEGVVDAAKLYKAEPFLSETLYQQYYKQGRIQTKDIDQVLIPWKNQRFGFGDLTVAEFIKMEMLHVNFDISESEVSFFEKKYYNIVLHNNLKFDEVTHFIEHLRIEEHIHPLLIRLCATYLDQGISYWNMNDRTKGLLLSSIDHLSHPCFLAPQGLTKIKKVLKKFQNLQAEDIIEILMIQWGVAPVDQFQFILNSLLTLPGWAGMISYLERNPQASPYIKTHCRLNDFVALYFLLTEAALSEVNENTAGLFYKYQKEFVVEKKSDLPRRMARIAKIFKFSQDEMNASSDQIWKQCFDYLQNHTEWERRYYFHLAYEYHHQQSMLQPLQHHLQQKKSQVAEQKPFAQLFFCIDEREESIRRHLEETSPEIETYGVAGFFGVSMAFQGLDQVREYELCPVVVKPKHRVQERPASGFEKIYHSRKYYQKLWSSLLIHYSLASKSLFRGWLSTLILGFISLFPFVLKILKPRLYGKWQHWIRSYFFPMPSTELGAMDIENDTAAEIGEKFAGFSLAEQADCVAGVLGVAGLKKNFSRLVVHLGHGSTSLNNPYESAYCCGACGGRSGGPNARIFALMANQQQVKAELLKRGFQDLNDTWFIGGYHDTCHDGIQWFDENNIPSTHREEAELLKVKLAKAQSLNAWERCRRFGTAPIFKEPNAARLHVQERSEHLAEPRPEYGHSTNAVAFVGKRSTTRGLFLDRRWFLISYDEYYDDEQKNLFKLLSAVIPVCGGISLEYYFSTVDNEVYGSGTKLPHNVTGLLGVMNGYMSDLRTGLPLQTVEIHEPMRILFIIEADANQLIKTIHQSELLTEFVEKKWIRLVSLDPMDHTMRVYLGNGQYEDFVSDDRFNLPLITHSRDWYAGHKDHLPIAKIAI